MRLLPLNGGVYLRKRPGHDPTAGLTSPGEANRHAADRPVEPLVVRDPDNHSDHSDQT